MSHKLSRFCTLRKNAFLNIAQLKFLVTNVYQWTYTSCVILPVQVQPKNRHHKIPVISLISQESFYFAPLSDWISRVTETRLSLISWLNSKCQHILNARPTQLQFQPIPAHLAEIHAVGQGCPNYSPPAVAEPHFPSCLCLWESCL